MHLSLALLVLLSVFASGSDGKAAAIGAAIGDGISAAADIFGAISSGTSMVAGGPDTYRVVCKFEVENWTKYSLVSPAAHINRGQLSSPPVGVKPGMREMFVAHKTAYQATGTFGTASWLISNHSKRAVIMWSCPFNFDHYSNWLAVGLSHSRMHKDWFNQMYYGSSGRGLTFEKGEYYYHSRAISVKDSEFEVVGTMGTSHKATARIIVKPLYERDLAPSIKGALRRRRSVGIFH